MEPPIGFIHLQDAADVVGRKLIGANWRSLSEIGAEAIAFNLNPDVDRVIELIAKQCEVGEIATAYRSLAGADSLDCGVWRLICWRNYFATGMINLDLPLLDETGRPNTNGYTARCEREVFVRRQDLDRLVDDLPRPPLMLSNIRNPSDVPLIQEALEAIAQGRAANPHQAAKLVAGRAEGSSEAQKTDRLRKLITAEIEAQAAKASPKIAKTSPNT